MGWRPSVADWGGGMSVCFIFLEVAADWHGLMIPCLWRPAAHCGHPLLTVVNNWTAIFGIDQNCCPNTTSLSNSHFVLTSLLFRVQSQLGLIILQAEFTSHHHAHPTTANPRSQMLQFLHEFRFRLTHQHNTYLDLITECLLSAPRQIPWLFHVFLTEALILIMGDIQAGLRVLCEYCGSICSPINVCYTAHTSQQQHPHLGEGTCA